MLSAEQFSSTVSRNNHKSSTLQTKFCPFCMTKAAHPRLGRGESYVCGYKPYHCEVCNYSTTTKGNLAIHQQSDKHLNNIQELEHGVLQRSPTLPSNSTIVRAMDRRLFSSVQSGASSKATSKCKANTLFRTNFGKLNSRPSCKQSEGQFYCAPTNRNAPEKCDPLQILLTPFLSNGFLHASNANSSYMDSVQCDELTTAHFVNKLVESSPYPLACRVCCAFTTDKTEILLKHAERNRIPSEHDPINASISLHSGGFWICRLCSYKSPLKANFQLHCKTEKHSQRLSLLMHICEGGPANQLRVLAPIAGVGEDDEEDTEDSITSSEKNSGERSCDPLQCAVRTNRNFNLSSNVQLVCLACNVFTTSSHKFRVHTQCPKHTSAVDIFRRLVSARKLLWTRLTAVTLTCIELTNGLAQFGSQLCNGNASAKSQDRFLANLGHTLSRLGVQYVCLCGCERGTTSGEEVQPNVHRTARQFFTTMSKALAHWHSTEHQQAITQIQKHQNVDVTSTDASSLHKGISDLDVFWTLGDISGSLDELPNLISCLLTVDQDSSNQKATTGRDSGLPPACMEIFNSEVLDTKTQHQPDIPETLTVGLDTLLSDTNTGTEHGTVQNTNEAQHNGYSDRSQPESTSYEEREELPDGVYTQTKISGTANCPSSLPSALHMLPKARKRTTGIDTHDFASVYVTDSSRLALTPTSSHVQIDDQLDYVNNRRPRSVLPLDIRGEELSSKVPQIQGYDQASFKEQRPKSVDAIQFPKNTKISITNSKNIPRIVESYNPDSLEQLNRPNCYTTTQVSASMTEYASGFHSPHMLNSVFPSVWKKREDNLRSTDEKTIQCYFCHEQIACSSLLIHMAMHFMQLSRNSTTKTANGKDASQVEAVNDRLTDLYQEFSLQPHAKWHLLSRTTSVIRQSKWSRLLLNRVCDIETFLSLLIELTAHSEMEDTELYRQVNSSWFQLGEIRHRQSVSSNSCTHCQAQFVLPTTLDLHMQLNHPNSSADAMTNSQLLQLFREACCNTSTCSETDPPTTNPNSTDLWNYTSHFSTKPGDVTDLLSFSNSQVHTLLHPGVNGMQPFWCSTSIPHAITGMLCAPAGPNTESAAHVQTTDNCSVADLATTSLQLPSSDLKDLPAFVNTPLQQRRGRTRLTEVQLSVLRSYFDISNSPSEEKIMEISAKTALQPKVIKHWFRNTLFKERQKNKDNPYNFSIPPSTSLNLEEYEKTGRIEVQPAPMELRSLANPSTSIDGGLASDYICPGIFSEQSIIAPEHRISTAMRINPNFNVEATSVRICDTDSSSASGFSMTPPSKRMRLQFTPDRADAELHLAGRASRESVDVSPDQMLSAPACDLSPMNSHERRLWGSGLDLKLPTPSVQPAHLHTSSALRVLMNGCTTVYCSVSSPTSNSSPALSQPQQLGAVIMPMHDSKINATMTISMDSDSPLDLSTTGMQHSPTHLPSASLGVLASAQLRPPCAVANLLENCPSVPRDKPYMNCVLHPIAHQSTSAQGNHGTRRNRTSITVLQSRCMQSIYAHHKTPSVHECDRLGGMIGLTRRVVQVWFQNQRAKEKKMARISSAYANSSVPQLNTASLGELAQFDSTFCNLCCVPIRSELLDHETQLTMPSSSTALTTHASFVDHLFSQNHLTKLINWCSTETACTQF